MACEPGIRKGLEADNSFRCRCGNPHEYWIEAREDSELVSWCRPGCYPGSRTRSTEAAAPNSQEIVACATFRAVPREPSRRRSEPGQHRTRSVQPAQSHPFSLSFRAHLRRNGIDDRLVGSREQLEGELDRVPASRPPSVRPRVLLRPATTTQALLSGSVLRCLCRACNLHPLIESSRASRAPVQIL